MSGSAFGFAWFWLAMFEIGWPLLSFAAAASSFVPAGSSGFSADWVPAGSDVRALGLVVLVASSVAFVAVETENFELAAEIRDRLRVME